MCQRILPILIFFLLASCVTPVQHDHDFVPGELLVQMAAGVTTTEADGIFTGYGLEMIEYFGNVAIAWVRVPEGEELEWKEMLPENELILSASLVFNRVTMR